MFQKKTCERCGKHYRTGGCSSKNCGRNYCYDCWIKCLVCGQKLPFAHRYGQDYTMSTLFIGNYHLALEEKKQKPWIGSGLCMSCYQNKVGKEQEEQQLLRQAQLVQARETIETPSTWTCSYCNAVNRGNFCFNCGSARQKIVREVE